MGYPYAPTTRTGTLSEAQYNADNTGLAQAMIPTNINDYSNDVTEMQTVVNPGGLGTESLATDLAGELARIRYMIKLMSGQAQWYIDPGATIAGAAFAAGTLMLFSKPPRPRAGPKSRRLTTTIRRSVASPARSTTPLSPIRRAQRS